MTDYGPSSLILRQNPKTPSKKGNQFEFTRLQGPTPYGECHPIQVPNWPYPMVYPGALTGTYVQATFKPHASSPSPETRHTEKKESTNMTILNWKS